jgi:hypothetical protein
VNRRESVEIFLQCSERVLQAGDEIRGSLDRACRNALNLTSDAMKHELDFGGVVSKYIGDTEKNIDRVFCDAQQCTPAIALGASLAMILLANGFRQSCRRTNRRSSRV